jgi:hypothetical protein
MDENAAPSGAIAANAACPRCGVAFRCGARDTQCACAAVLLDDALRAELRVRWQGCLCVGCLQALRERSP